ncbi:helix-turn-helix domain-containing protein [Siculibacillus lacustris]|nr:helix-turn-helix domain-containing protein [Siculibacillus lacustris]
MSDDSDHDLNAHIAARVRALRTARGLTLEALAERSGVSRSMLSTIERAESSPTAVLLDRVAAGLGVMLASLFDRPEPPPDPIARAADQPRWRDPQSGYVRRNVSPAGFPSPIRIVEVEFPPGSRIAYPTGGLEGPIHQQVWVLDGTIEITVGDDVHALETGDCLAFVLDRPTAFANRSDRPARYAVVIVERPDPWRRPDARL